MDEMERRALVHLFETPYAKYVYDVNRNALIENSALYEYYSHELPASREVKELLSEKNKQCYLLADYPEYIVHPQADDVDYHLMNKINSITLQLTQRCNFRCTYCIYSENSSPLQRAHSDGVMSFHLAKKAVDFLFSHSRDINKVNIGFYGGEPLLEFDLIKKIVEYIETNYYGKEVNYSITTNGSLLTDATVAFMEKHSIYPMISFDGPKNIHDKYRHFAKNGQGTYDAIMKCLEHIKKNYPTFFARLKFSTVIDPQNDLGCINQCLLDYYQYHNITSHISLLSDAYGAQKVYKNEKYLFRENDEYIKTMLFLLQFVDGGVISPIATSLVDSIQRLATSFKKEHAFSLQTSPGGPCIPGTIRLFVSCDGTFYPCEHVSECSEVMKIGNINTGFDKAKVLKLLNVASLTEEQCKKCFAYHHCFQCAKYCDNAGELSKDLRLKECYYVRKTIHSQIKYYLMLKELMGEKNENTNLKESCYISIIL